MEAKSSLLLESMLSSARAHAAFDPERLLRLAVLERALDDFRSQTRATNAHGRRLFEEAAQWFAGTEPDVPFSFENVCAALDLDADLLRRSLAHWRAIELAGAAQRWLDDRSARARRHAA